MLRRVTCLTIVLLALSLQAACSSSQSLTNSDAERDPDSTAQSPAVSGFDVDALQALDQRLEAGDFPNIHMVLVEHQGRQVYAKYLAGEDEKWGSPLGYRKFGPDSLHDLRSVSKSITSLLVGIALGDDFKAQLQRPILDFFPQLRAQAAEGAEQVTLHHVLTMTAGFQWNEMEVSYASRANDERRLYHTYDPISYVLSRPLVSTPGEEWYYSGGSTMLLAGVVEQVSGRDFLEFAQRELAEPLGIDADEVEWLGLGIWRGRLTLPSAASGLRSSLPALAKIGRLVINDGAWQGRQVLPRGWAEWSTRRHTEQTFSRWSNDGIYGYGYQWWHGNFRGEYGEFTAIAGVGLGGQRLFILPERDLVVTVFAGNYRTSAWWASEKLLAAIVAAAP